RLSSEEKGKSPWVLVATAHPAKFNEIVEPIIGKNIDVPEGLSRLLQLPRHFLDLPPTLQAVTAALT
ncbi:MAG: threonine synthase, partial [Pseudomonadota bacterium]|nr:threonine synthase [Pseudomonadota bacterium]